jgi:hypothetical protein
MAKRPNTKARVKLVAAGPERFLLLRFVPFSEHIQRSLGGQVRDLVPEDKLTFDGEVFGIRHELAMERVLKLLRSRCDVVYDPNLLHGRKALPNPWPIPSAPERDWTKKPIIYMARVLHPELGEALAFQSPEYDDDFMIDFRRELSDARPWRRFRKDLDRVPVWVVAEYYAPRVHDVLDRYFDCRWEEFMAGEEWDILDPPEGTQYPTRKLEEQDFHVLGVKPYCGIDEINAAYREQKEGYQENRIAVEQWLDIDLAYQRIRRHHFPSEPELPGEVIGPVEVVRGLRDLLPDDASERVRWFHSFHFGLGGIPARLVETPEGTERVVRYLRLLQATAVGRNS